MRMPDWILSAAKAPHLSQYPLERLLSVLISEADHGVIVGQILEFSGARLQRQIHIIDDGATIE
jgi:hypothetical protein